MLLVAILISVVVIIALSGCIDTGKEELILLDTYEDKKNLTAYATGEEYKVKSVLLHPDCIIRWNWSSDRAPLYFYITTMNGEKIYRVSGKHYNHSGEVKLGDIYQMPPGYKRAGIKLIWEHHSYHYRVIAPGVRSYEKNPTTLDIHLEVWGKAKEKGISEFI